MTENYERPYRGAAEIQQWLVVYLAKELNMISDEIDVKMPFDRFGLSSLRAVLMTGEMEEWLGRPIDPTLPYDYPTVEVLAQHLGLPAVKKVAR